MRRRPAPQSGPQAPERLRRFVANEWSVPPLKEHATEWEAEWWPVLGPFYVWRDARRLWSAGHGDTLGNFLERLHFERAARRGSYFAQTI
jgi:hypothetical protein